MPKPEHPAEAGPGLLRQSHLCPTGLAYWELPRSISCPHCNPASLKDDSPGSSRALISPGMCESHGQFSLLTAELNLLLRLPERRVQPSDQGPTCPQLFPQKVICTWRRLLELRAQQGLDLALVCTEQTLVTSAPHLQGPKQNMA